MGNGIQLTRGFRALKARMAFSTYGVDRIGRLIEQNLNQAVYLAQAIEARPEFELLAPVELNIVCFRFIDPAVPEDRLNAFNDELLIRLQESGAAVPSSTHLNGRFALRCAITNHRSRKEDFDRLLDSTSEIGLRLVEEGWTG